MHHQGWITKEIRSFPGYILGFKTIYYGQNVWLLSSQFCLSSWYFQSFKQMIASCLVKDPSKRPSAKKLLKHSFFKQARSSDYIARKLLDGLPDLVNRVQAIKVRYVDLSR